ncbi:unknown [Eggerthella sp. CAG:298]|nr:unknown [Eggerthella sp. CAG:298]
MIRHDLECSMLNTALFGGGLTDEHHEQHHRRQKDDNDNARDPIGTGDSKREHERQDYHVHQLRQNELEILLHLVDAFECHGSTRCGAETLR